MCEEGALNLFSKYLGIPPAMPVELSFTFFPPPSSLLFLFFALCSVQF